MKTEWRDRLWLVELVTFCIIGIVITGALVGLAIIGLVSMFRTG